jgi:hypothetical protein
MGAHRLSYGGARISVDKGEFCDIAAEVIVRSNVHDVVLLEDNCATAAAGYWIFHHDGDTLGSIDNARTILSQKGVELGCSVIFGSVDGKGAPIALLCTATPESAYANASGLIVLISPITTRGWCSGSRISCIGCVCTSKEGRRSGELENYDTGCRAKLSHVRHNIS